MGSKRPANKSTAVKAAAKIQRAAGSSSAESSPSFQRSLLLRFDETSRSPPFFIAFGVFLLPRLIACIYSTPADCDETYNFWEPVKHIMYPEEQSQQTWEYDPAFGLRSWLYVGSFGMFLKFLQMILPVPVGPALFINARFVLATVSSTLHTVLFAKLRDAYADKTWANLYLLFAALAPGCVFSDIALLPTSLAACMSVAVLGLSHAKAYNAVPWFLGIAVIVGWPFAGLALLPLMLDNIRSTGILRSILNFTAAAVVISCFVFAADTFVYKKPVFSTLNILLYNVFGVDGGSSTLYGVEDALFYLRNGLLNLNIVLPIAIITPIITLLFTPVLGIPWSDSLSSGVKHSGTALWLGFLSCIPHKEERFATVVFPMACYAAAFSIMGLRKVLYLFCMRTNRQFTAAHRPLVHAIMVLFSTISILRLSAIIGHYGAPMQAWKAANQLATNVTVTSGDQVNICVGKEWYRLPSSFYIPPGARLGFVYSGFKGQLPQDFASDLSVPRSNFNPLNLEENDRYMPLSECSILVELLEGDDMSNNFPSLIPDQWQKHACFKFLDGKQTSSLARVLRMPSNWGSHSYHEYCVLRNTRNTEVRDTTSVKNIIDSKSRVLVEL